MNDSRLLLLVLGPNLALWGALFGEATLAPDGGVQAMAPVPTTPPTALLPLPAQVPDVRPPQLPSVVPVQRPRQLRVFQPRVAAVSPAPRAQAPVVAADPIPAPASTPAALPVPVTISVPGPDQLPSPDTSVPAPQEATEELPPSPADLQEAVLRARALLPEPLDTPTPLP